MKAALVLLPNLLGEGADPEASFTPAIFQEVLRLDGLIAESEKAGRRFLKQMIDPFRGVPIRLLNEHTRVEELGDLLAPIAQGERWGLISDCGLPCIADPGALLVQMAGKKNITVIAYPGPSSVMLALMLSGLPGQSFEFCGYLPKDAAGQIKKIKELEKRSREEKSTKLFIEVPYHVDKMLQMLIQHLAPMTQLSIACDLMLPTQWVRTASVAHFRKEPPPVLGKRLVVYTISAAMSS